jgi:hypothetical protein
MSPTRSTWGWRQRIVDPRFPAMVALGVCSGVLGTAVFGGGTGSAVLGVALITAVSALAGLAVLPPWRDPKHGPVAGAAVLYAGAAITLVAGLLGR